MERPGQRPAKDEDAAHPIAAEWRPALAEIVKALAEGDWCLTRGIAGVAEVAEATGDQIQAYLAAFGETLTELPEATWKSSVAQWMGSYWDVLVDLWTVESGKSDLALCLRVVETNGGYSFEVESVHVP